MTEKQYQQKPLADEPFVGVWKDRKEMSDSVSWNRQNGKPLQLKLRTARNGGFRFVASALRRKTK